MVAEDTAKDIFRDVRAFYKGGLKSSNKRYETSVFDSAEVKSKKANRNYDQEVMSGLSNRLRQLFPGKTLFDCGRLLYNTGNNAGNCGEMAAVAMYVAVDKYHVSKAEVEIWSFRNRDHTAGFLSNASRGSTLSFGHEALALGPKNATQWFVDPWAGVCCAYREYPNALGQQLDKWAAQGKRISVSWNTAEGPKGFWTTANSDDVKAITNPGSKVVRLSPDDQLP